MFRFFILFLSMLMSVSPVFAGGSGVCGGTDSTNSSTTSPYYYQDSPITISGISMTNDEMDTYYMIVDDTQGPSAKVIITNPETSQGKAKPLPLIGVDKNPYAAINDDKLPYSLAVTTGLVQYVEVDVLHSNLTTNSLPSNQETNATKGVVGTALTGNTYVNRLGSWDASANKVTPLTDGSGNDLVLNNLFDPNNRFGGQAFNLDRIRFAANKLWVKWKSDVLADSTGTASAATNWHKKFGYQPTGTMSYEQFMDNIINGKPMFGIVRVVIPVSGGNAQFSADYRTNCVNGNEFTGTNATTCQLAASGSGAYINSSNQAGYHQLNEAYAPGAKCGAKKIEVYGMLLYDYVTQSSYSPTEFADANQHYKDNFSAGSKNVADTSNFYLKVYESVLINQVNDHYKVSTGTGHPLIAGQDYRMDSLEAARAYMKEGLTTPGTTPGIDDVDDAYKFEYLMRAGVSDTDPNTPSADVRAYNFNTETFPSSTGNTARAEFATAWDTMKDKDKYHALFPSGYERGWMIAFDALDMTTADWAKLPTEAPTTVGSANTSATKYEVIWVTKKAINGNTKTDYAPFKVPSETLDIDVYFNGASYYSNAAGEADSDPADNAIPNTFTKDFEDFPGLAFASGTLDMHGHANISGMLYTPNAGEMETKGDKNASFQYVNGAILVGGGIYFQDGCATADGCTKSLIAISYNPFAFDQLRTAPVVHIHKPTNIREIQGQ